MPAEKESGPSHLARVRRKLDHVRLAIESPHSATGWDDLHLVHQSLPQLDLADLRLDSSLAGVALTCPIIINAMTGGAAEVGLINSKLAALAAEFGIAMAVGSQRAGLDDPALAQSYAVVRHTLPNGVVLANLGAGATPAEAERAVAMIGADLLQIHLNAPQELVMSEGDRDFSHWLERIGELVSLVRVPVVVKESGYGLSREAVRALYGVGVRAVDLGGYGGTNFTWIEAERRGIHLDRRMIGWGNPAASCLGEVLALALPGLDVVASGGLQSGVEAACALAMGAAAVGVAGGLLRQLQGQGIEAARVWLHDFIESLRAAMLLTGAADLASLRKAPLVVDGPTAYRLKERGVDTSAWARRPGPWPLD